MAATHHTASYPRVLNHRDGVLETPFETAALLPSSPAGKPDLVPATAGSEVLRYSSTFSPTRLSALPYWEQQKIAMGAYMALSCVAWLTALKYLSDVRTLLLFVLGAPAGLLGTIAGGLFFSQHLSWFSLERVIRAVSYLSLGCAILCAVEAALCVRTLISLGEDWTKIENLESLPTMVTLHVIVFATLTLVSSFMTQRANYAYRLLEAAIGFIAV